MKRNIIYKLVEELRYDYIIIYKRSKCRIIITHLLQESISPGMQKLYQKKKGA